MDVSTRYTSRLEKKKKSDEKVETRKLSFAQFLWMNRFEMRRTRGRLVIAPRAERTNRTWNRVEKDELRTRLERNLENLLVSVLSERWSYIYPNSNKGCKVRHLVGQTISPTMCGGKDIRRGLYCPPDVSNVCAVRQHFKFYSLNSRK